MPDDKSDPKPAHSEYVDPVAEMMREKQGGVPSAEELEKEAAKAEASDESGSDDDLDSVLDSISGDDLEKALEELGAAQSPSADAEKAPEPQAQPAPTPEPPAEAAPEPQAQPSEEPAEEPSTPDAPSGAGAGDDFPDPEQLEEKREKTGTELVAPRQFDDGEVQRADDGEGKHIPLGERLIRKGVISRDQLDIALKIQRDHEGKGMLGAVLVDLGFITESTLGEVLAESSGVEQFDPKTSIIDPELIKKVPKDVAVQFKAVPILREGDQILVAMVDIYNVLAIDRIQRYFPKSLKMVPIHCTELDLAELINNYYDYELSIGGILREIESGEVDELVKNAATDEGYTNPTVRLVDAVLMDAVRSGASDIHLEPEGSFVRLRYRVDGKLIQVRSFHKDYWNAILVRTKIMSDMSITETRIPQDGRISCTVMGRKIDFRVATQPTIYGENVVLRILDKAKALLPMEKLGYSDVNIKNLTTALKRPEGVIIVTGPTGSGKTTTLYSVLNSINKPDVNIMTLEDPVEYQLPMIRQSNIRAAAGMDFASGVKSLLRQDPDIIFIGEVRDKDTAIMALRAAMTGHQVFTSLHTNDALGAIPRLVDVGVEPQMLAGSIIAAVAQRLARRLCPKCKTKRRATPEECRIMDVDQKAPPEIYAPAGCEHCGHRGYRGRVAISEVLLVDDVLDELIAKNATKSEMLRHLKQKGFVPMADDGVEKVLAGLLDVDELVRTIDMTERM